MRTKAPGLLLALALAAAPASALADNIASCWPTGGSGVSVFDVPLTDGQPHALSLYLLDWDQGGRSERLDLKDAAGTLLDSRTVSAFAGGQYVRWNVSGHVTVTVTLLASVNAVVSGVFLDPPSGTGTFIGTDTATQGAWVGKYGADGYAVAEDAAKAPAYGSISPPAGTYVWASTTADVRALQKAGSAAPPAAVAIPPAKTVSWTASADATTTGYHVWLDGAIASSVDAATTSAPLPAMSAGLHTITVSSFNANGDSPQIPSPGISVKFSPPAVPTAPLPPTNVSVH